MSKFVYCKECGGSGRVGQEGWGIGEHQCPDCGGKGYTDIIFDDCKIILNGKKVTSKKKREKILMKLSRSKGR